jgi:SAM-dependent methyltransferase
MSPSHRGLSAGHFRRIAVNGFGDGGNTYAWSCAWYDDHVYIGTNRHQLVIARLNVPIKHQMKIWPVLVPKKDTDFDLSGQIWRYSPATDTWERVYRSPLAEGINGEMVALAAGFRNMAVFQGKSDAQPAIYTIPSCNSRAIGPVLLRCADGRHFEVASEQGLGLGNPNILSYRGNVPFKGRLFITPAGSRGQVNASYRTMVYCSDDPARGNWQVSNPDGFGDPNNHGIFEMAATANFLYAATVNVRYGLQLWKTDGEGPPPHRWTLAMDRGADRGPLNQSLACLAAHGDVMYLGTGIQHGGYDRFNNIGPAAAEILRIYPDDTWDLVVGQARMTRQGFKVPTSGYGPGFDNPACGYMWRLRSHDGCIYAGTHESTAFAPFIDTRQFSDTQQRLLDDATLEHFLEALGGCELWRSHNGDDWVPITRNGFGNLYNWGIRALLSTPKGLFVGTSNPFGPKIAVEGPFGWRYEDNPLGGLEVWHGAPENAGRATGSFPTKPARAIPLFADNLMACPEVVAALSQDDSPTADAPPGADGERRELLQSLLRSGRALTGEHAVTAFEGRHERVWGADPVRELAAAESDLVGLTEDIEEELRQYSGAGGLRNVGYWRHEASTPQLAAGQLVKELLAAGLPERPATVLALGPDAAALARYLRQHWPAATVSDVATEAGLAPLPDGSVDIVLWVEGPSATDRAAALRAVRRVLKSGGRLLAADLLGGPEEAADTLLALPDAAKLVEAYQADLAGSGFVKAQVVNVTRQTWSRFYRHSREHFAAKLLLNQLDQPQYDRILKALPGGGMVVAAYVAVSAEA